MVLVDVSGFTSMSERLARHGKVGAEEVTEVIGTTFDRLTAAAYAFGATLLKFGGDALLLFCRGDAHHLRACAAAVQMRQTLRDVGAFHTTAGQVALRMSVGVHSGAFDFFMIGGSHRELMIAGPAATETTRLEGVAEAGQIVISAATAALLPRRVVGRELNGGYLLAGRVDAVRAETKPAPSKVDLVQFIPTALREPLLSGEMEPEHRPAVVAFIRFSEFDELVANSGPEQAAASLDLVTRAVQVACDAREVTFLSTDIAAGGGKFILTSGVPQATGYDAEQMLLALNDITSTQLELPVHIGVNWGPVFTGAVVLRYRRTYTVMGDTVNLAARLMSKAAPGEIVATKEVLDLSRTLFTTEARQPFLVKGKKLPIQAFTVGEPCGSRVAPDVGTPLVGRDHELKLMESAWRSAVISQGRFVELVAEPGMGKSRLLQEFVQSGERRVIEAECRLYQTGTPYFPIRTLLRQVLGIERMDPMEARAALASQVEAASPALVPLLSLIGVVLDLEIEESAEVAQLDEQFRPARTMAAVGSLFEAVVTTPTLFVVEDTHWMDQASQEVLAGLLTGLERQPWLFVLTRRPGDYGFVAPQVAHSTRIELQPLTRHQAEALIREATADGPLLPRQVATLAERSDGSPLFLIELLSALRQGGAVEQLPQSVDGLISARIDRLPAADRNLLQRVAVLGNGFETEHTASVLPTLEPQARLRAFRRLADFLTLSPSGWLEFRHALIRDVAYGELPFKTRLELHARVGDSICEAAAAHPEKSSELLSLHYFEARRWGDAWHFSRLAGDSASQIYANQDAALFYERATESARFLPGIEPVAKAEVLSSLGDVREKAGMFTQALDAYRRATQLTDDPVALAELKLKRSVVRMRQGAFSQALRDVAAGLRLTETAHSPKAARMTAQLLAHGALVRMAQEKDRPAIELAQRARLEAEAAGESQALATALSVLDTSYRWLGETDKAIYSQQALDLYEELGDLSGKAALIGNLGIAAYFEGRWTEALRLYEESRETQMRAGNEVQAAIWSANIAEILINQRKIVPAEALLRELLPTLQAAGLDSFAFAELQMGRVLAARGDLDAAISLISGALSRTKEMGQSITAIDASIELASCLVLADLPEKALDQLAGVDTPSAGAYGPALHRVRARALAAEGLVIEALGEIGQGLEVALHRQDPYEKALLTLARAELGRRFGLPIDEFSEEEARRTLGALGVDLSGAVLL